jgi:hypothetical protein
MSLNKKKKTTQNLLVQTAHKREIEFTNTIPLPKIKHAGKYFKTFCKKCKFNRATVSVKNLCLFITAENEEALANVHIIIEKEIKSFIENNRSLVKMVPQKKISPITKSRRKNEKLIPQRIIRTVRLRDDQHSKHVNQIFRQKRRHLNNIKTIWKQWYINRLKFNAKFKAISRYFGQLYRRRDCNVSLNRQKKRSPFEYHKQKVLGRRRDRLKVKHAQRSKRKNKPRKTKKNKGKWKIHNKTTTYKPIPNEHEGTASQISKLKFIAVDSAETMMFQSREFDFSLLACINKILVDRKQFVIRYYNQQMFIYTPSVGTSRPLKRNLIGTFSTLNEDQMESNRHTEHTRFSPIKQPDPIIQQNINSSRKKNQKQHERLLIKFLSYI